MMTIARRWHGLIITSALRRLPMAQRDERHGQNIGLTLTPRLAGTASLIRSAEHLLPCYANTITTADAPQLAVISPMTRRRR